MLLICNSGFSLLAQVDGLVDFYEQHVPVKARVSKINAQRLNPDADTINMYRHRRLVITINPVWCVFTPLH